MGTLLPFKASARTPSSSEAVTTDGPSGCEVVIFPGVRIERHESTDLALDLSHRLCDSAGRDDFGGHRPRKTS